MNRWDNEVNVIEFRRTATGSLTCRLGLIVFAMAIGASSFHVPFCRGEQSAVNWEVGFAESIITPQEPVVMSGYANRTEPSEGTINELRVKALALESKKGGKALLITADVLGFRTEVADPIYDRITQQSGLDRSQIMLNSSHTHTGPSQITPRSLALLKEEYVASLSRYTEYLKDQVVETALRALEDSKSASLSFGKGHIDFVMNRRIPTVSGVRMGPNPRGPVDRSVPVLKISASDGELLGVIFGASCHNTTLTPRHTRFCGDFSGFAQERIERAYPGVYALFIQGCGGDANPFPRGEISYALQHGDSLGDEVIRLLEEEELRSIEGPLRSAMTQIELPLVEVTDSYLEELRNGPSQWKRNAAVTLEEELSKGSLSTHYSTSFSLWRFGEDLTLVGLPGEAVYDYTIIVERALGPSRLWITSYNHDVFGYLPSTRILREGGYESRGLYAGRQFDPEVESVVEAGLRKLAKNIEQQRGE